MSMTLYINACVREKSRTEILSNELLSKLGEYEEVKLENIDFPKTNEAFLKKRDSLIASRTFDDPMFDLARQFAKAETIVIAAPYWDLSFPAMLKQYIEHINVLGITFEYTPEGIPKGLCRASRLYYVMTAGGTYVPEEFGFGYIKSLAENFYGIRDIKLIKATGLDIYS
ncbi:MAG: ACP phosphodiesterase [Pseudobutyrivibrio sp.]|nr:ACP phosphodiesterase [Pseudobutyrivibrio sp.]